MATRLYLPSSGTSALNSLVDDSGWDEVSGTFFRAPMSITKTDTALTDFYSALSVGGQYNAIFAQWVSAPLADDYSFTTSDTIDFVAKVIEDATENDTYWGYKGRVVSNTGSEVIGSFASGLTVQRATEFPYSAASTRTMSYICAAVSAVATDRLVFELGTYENWTGGGATIRLGDPSGTGDFALTDSLTTDLCPWLELSPNLTFSEEEGEEAPVSSYMSLRRGMW